jgi:hypothetical protein
MKASGKRFTIEDLERLQKKGFGINFNDGKTTIKKEAVKKVEPVFKNICTVIKIPYCLAGLNGSKGLMRAHFSEVKKQKEKLKSIIATQTKNKHLGFIRIEFSRFAHKLMDWDNHCASFKHIGDTLKDCGIIVDDNPKIVIQFIPYQFKIKMAEKEYMIVKITDVE